MISIVVVYNDQHLLDTMLRASVKRQRQEYEFIAIDNTTGRYPSAAAALNVGGRRARGELILFAHQDVAFEGETWLENAAQMVLGLPNVGVAGVAGVATLASLSSLELVHSVSEAQAALDRERYVLVSNIEDGVPPRRVTPYAIRRPELVESVDECAFFVPRAVFQRFPFDERACNGWHLYGVDLSLTVRAAGLDAYVVPLPLYHRSGGAVETVLGFTTLAGAYFRALRRVARKHRRQYPILHTSCGSWSARHSILLQRFPPREVLRVWLRRAPQR